MEKSKQNKLKLNEQLFNVIFSPKDSKEAKLKKVKYLIRLGANVNQKVNGKSLLKIVREKGYKEIENVIKESLMKSFEKLLDGDKFERVLDECEYANGRKVVVSKQKAIDLGKQFWDEDGNLKSAKEIEDLILQGAYVDIEKRYGYTPLMIASENGYKDVVEVLLEGGADVNIKDNNGWTALMEASYYGHKKVVGILLEGGADVNIKDKDGWTALMYASLSGNVRVVEMLLEKGADVNIQNKAGWTALMMALPSAYNEVNEMLLHEDKYHWRVLMGAPYYIKENIVQMLLEKGADANIRNNQGRRVWDEHDKEIVKVIKEHIKKTSGEPTNGGFLGKIFGGLTR